MIDVNCNLNKGQFINTDKGKIGKIFDPDDNDALKILSDFMNIQLITYNKRSLKNLINYFNFR